MWICLRPNSITNFHYAPLLLPSSRQQSVSCRCSVHGLESSSRMCFSSLYSDSCCSRENAMTSVQKSSNSSFLATTTVVLRTSTLIVSPDSSATNSKTLDSVQRKIHSSKPPSSRREEIVLFF